MDLGKEALRKELLVIRSGNVTTSACKEKRTNIVACMNHLQA